MTHVMRTPPHEEHVQSLLLSAHQAAQLLGISERLVWAMAARGDIMKVKVGRRALIPRTEVERIAAGG